MVGEKVYFHVTVSSEDVKKVMRALGKTFDCRRDEPIKTVFLAMTVAELEVIMYKELMKECCTNIDEVIAGVRLQAELRAKYIHDKMQVVLG